MPGTAPSWPIQTHLLELFNPWLDSKGSMRDMLGLVVMDCVCVCVSLLLLLMFGCPVLSYLSSMSLSHVNTWSATHHNQGCFSVKRGLGLYKDCVYIDQSFCREMHLPWKTGQFKGQRFISNYLPHTQFSTCVIQDSAT